MLSPIKKALACAVLPLSFQAQAYEIDRWEKDSIDSLMIDIVQSS
ncbi:hypothetical protein [Cobetia crustatorum]|nr:hypothetical protein [Cobetia crustatorum]